MKKKIDIKNICIFLSFILFITSQVIPKEMTDLDEIWNFNFANCLSNGLIPYKDFNIIQGPLIPFICSIFLRVFGQEMIVTRILTILGETLYFIMIYKIMENLKIVDYLKYIVCIVLAIIMREYFSFDYNLAISFVILLITKIELNKEKQNWKTSILIGIIAGLAITIKQTMGLVIVVATLGYRILEIRSKEDLKKYIKNTLFKLLGIFIVVLIFLLVLLSVGVIQEYIDYCIKGVKTFSNSISYIERLVKNDSILIKVLSVCPPIIYITLLVSYFKDKDRNGLVLLCFCVVQLMISYPISDENHFVISICLTIVGTVYILNKLRNKFLKKNKLEIVLNSFFECFIVLSSIYLLVRGIQSYKSSEINTKLNHFKYLPKSNLEVENVITVDKYIESQEKKVYILDPQAALYMIPIDRYNKNYDMFLNGNLGSGGEESQIENLRKQDNEIVLILNSKYNKNWQTPIKVIEYVEKEMKKTGEIGIFDIYE